MRLKPLGHPSIGRSLAASPSGVHFQGGQERRLRNLHLAELAHPLLALFLFFEELRLRGPATGMGQAGPARRGTLSATSRIGPKWESGLSWAASDEAPRVEGIA